jgi:hypothetical protein
LSCLLVLAHFSGAVVVKVGPTAELRLVQSAATDREVVNLRCYLMGWRRRIVSIEGNEEQSQSVWIHSDEKVNLVRHA